MGDGAGLKWKLHEAEENLKPWEFVTVIQERVEEERWK